MFVWWCRCQQKNERRGRKWWWWTPLHSIFQRWCNLVYYVNVPFVHTTFTRGMNVNLLAFSASTTSFWYTIPNPLLFQFLEEKEESLSTQQWLCKNILDMEIFLASWKKEMKISFLFIFLTTIKKIICAPVWNGMDNDGEHSLTHFTCPRQTQTKARDSYLRFSKAQATEFFCPQLMIIIHGAQKINWKPIFNAFVLKTPFFPCNIPFVRIFKAGLREKNDDFVNPQG